MLCFSQDISATARDEAAIVIDTQDWQKQLQHLVAIAQDAAALQEALSGPLQAWGLSVIANEATTVVTAAEAQSVAAAEEMSADLEKAKAPESTGELALDARVSTLEPSPTLGFELLDKVQFAMHTFYFSESDVHATIKVLRLGTCSSTGQIRFATQNGSAIAGENFEEQTGVLEFLPGEQAKDIRIKLIPNFSWDATKEFRMLLSDEEGLELSSSLRMARCKIVDDDTFPTNKYEKQLQKQRTATELPSTVGFSKGKAPPWGVLWEYIKTNFRNPVVRRGSIKLFLKDQIFNGFGIAQLYLFKYLTDEILLSQGQSHQRVLVELVGLGLILLCFRGITHFLTFRAVFWKVGGASRKFLMTNLLRRWLAYDVEVQQQLVPTSSLIESVHESACELVDLGYMPIFTLAKDAGNLLCLAIFQAVNVGPLEMLPMILLPAVMALYMRMRSQSVIRNLRKAHHQDGELVDHLSRTANAVTVLRDFSKRAEQIERFSITVNNYNSALVDVAAQDVNAQAVPDWLGDILVVFFVTCGGYFLVTHDPSLEWMMAAPEIGAFQAALSVFQSTAASLKQIYTALLSMQQGFASLEEIVVLLNIEIEDSLLLARSKQEQEENAKAWHVAMQGDFTPEFEAYLKAKKITRIHDSIPIEVRKAGLSLDPCVPVFDMTIYQGEMVAITNTGTKFKAGKSLFLQLLAGWLKPKHGSVFIPQHLKVSHVTVEQVFFSKRSLLQNLCVGLHHGEQEDSVDRCQGMLARFGFDKEAIDQVASDGDWLHLFSHRQRSLLSIIRALVAKPDVLLLHYPLYLHEPLRRLEVLAVLREYVDKRGFLLPGHYRQRSPCTCVFTAAFVHGDEMRYVDREVQFPQEN